MTELFSLGDLYPSDFLKESEEPRSPKVEMKLIMDDDGLVRLEKTAEFDKMYGKYWYRSGINKTMKVALKDVVDSIVKIQPIDHGDIWLDIACNDGTLLSNIPYLCKGIGYDPADDTYLHESEKHGTIVQDFFTAESFKDTFGDVKAKVVTSIAMFYDVPDPKKLIRDVMEVLDDDGIWVMQLSYSPLMIRQMAFDNICHEHIYYYSLFNLRALLREQGFYVDDCDLNEVNGGSIRLYIKKSSCSKRNDIGNFRVFSLLAAEQEMGMDKISTWIDWFKDIEDLKNITSSFVQSEKAQGKSIWAYGASTKGNTLLQYFGLDNSLIDAIADRNPAKHGLRTVGTNVPIKSEEEMRVAMPDYLLILPWHFIKEFQEREYDYLHMGGKMIVPCPSFQIVKA